MKILEIYPFPDVKHGTEISMHLGAEGLRSLGHSTFLLHAMQERPQTAEMYDAELGVPLVFDRDSKLPPPGLKTAEAQVDAFVAQHGIDLLHVHGYPRTETLERWTRRYPVVTSVHVPLCPNGARYLWADRCACDRAIGLGCLTTGYAHKGCGHLGNGKPMGLPGFLRGMVEDHRLHRAISRSGRVIANSEWMQARLIADGMPPEIMRMVHEPIVVGEDDFSMTALEKPPIVTFIGRLVDFKGPDYLLRASKQITQEHRLWFIGAGPMQAQLQQLSQQLGIADRVTFFGSLPPDQIAEYRLQSSVIVVPSVWPEPFAMVGPEAMLMRRPVVGCRVGGIPEWLQDGVTGRLVEPGDVTALADAIGGLLDDPVGAAAMGEAARRLAMTWVPTNHATHLLAVFDEAFSDLRRSNSPAVATGASPS